MGSREKLAQAMCIFYYGISDRRTSLLLAAMQQDTAVAVHSLHCRVLLHGGAFPVNAVPQCY